MKILSTISFIVFTCVGFGQVYEEIYKAVSSDREIDDRAGYAVAVEGDYAVVGAYGDDFSSENEGSVYVYKRTGVSSWDFLQKLTSSDQEGYDRFGWSVAMDNDYLVVGAYAEDDDLSGGDSKSKAGSAYVFKRDGSGMYIEVQKLIAPDRDVGDEFGWSVDIHDSTIVVGAHTEDHSDLGSADYEYNAGSVYMFDLDITGTWNFSQKVVPIERNDDHVYPEGYSGEDLSDLFGGCVAISGDYMIVGSHMHDYGPGASAYQWNAGTAYIFERDGTGTWNQAIKLLSFDRDAWDRFGWDVDIDSNVAVVCARAEDEGPDGVTEYMHNTGSVYIYERNAGGSWLLDQKIIASDREPGDHFGNGLSIDGDIIVLATHSNNTDASGGDTQDNAGAAYVFHNDGGTWTQHQKLVASDRDVDDEFGWDARVEGNTVIVGAPYQKFDATGASPIEEAGAAYFFSQDICEDGFSTLDTTICSGQSITIEGSTYDSEGTFINTFTKPDGCDSTITINLTLTPPPVYYKTVNLCYGLSYSIGGTTYTTSGIYNDTLTATGGCDSVVVTDLTIEDENAVTQEVSICWGEEYSIGASTYNVSGTYTDIITSSTFCDSVITTILTVELPVNIAVTASGSQLSAAAADAEYQWMKCENDFTIPGATNQTYIASTAGEYAVIVTENGCTDTSSCVFISSVGITDTDFEFSIFPNPTNSKIILSFENPSRRTIEVLDQSGKILLVEYNSENSVELDFSKFDAGIYFTRISGAGATITKKVLKN
ncbi:MAG: T9SS type A sorting domain-containing protein [Crocinitomicaceae bacterium]|nr:T9SS type A sorting domain-containing protein [Crocinitomicaceae bacterium]